jgi:hypothetical protein
MRRPQRRVRPFSIVVLALVIAVFAALGFRVGRSDRTSTERATSAWDAATAMAYSHSRSGAYKLAWRLSYGHGLVAARAAASAAGTRAGRLAGEAQSAARVAAARALAAALPLAPNRLTPGTRTDKCVPVGGGLCEVLGPAVTGKPCPRASVPNPEGGVVCVPRVLILAARLAEAARGALAR